MIDFRKARYIVSAPSPLKAPSPRLPEILFIGRSNVGKSTLINALTGQKIAYSSKKAGKTKALNYFKIDESFYIVDAPGYGKTSYATSSTIHFSKMMEEYAKLDSLKGIVSISDLRHAPGKEDREFIDYLQSLGKPIIYVVSKADMMNQKETSLAKRFAGELGLIDPIFSKLDPDSLFAIRSAISKLV